MAYGPPYPADLPLMSAGVGFRTPFGITLLPPGSRVAAFVRSTGVQSADDQFTATNLVTTLSAGLARARSGLGDTVVVLPGHSESVTDATMLTNLVPGTRVVGIGRGSNMPTFRWTATAAQWVVDDADVIFQGLRLRLEGANGVVKAIVVTAADVGFYQNDIEVGSGASNKATIALEIGTGAARCEVISNNFRGSVAGAVTDGVKIVGVADGIRIQDNEMIFASAVANGNVNVTVAATGLRILRNYMYNTVAASTACIAVANAGSDGIIAENSLAITDTTATPASAGIVFTSTGSNIRCFDNLCTDTPRTSGALSPAVIT